MKCKECGCTFKKSEAAEQFNREFHYDLDYEFDAPGLCGDCAVLYMLRELHRNEPVENWLEDDEDEE